MPNHRTLIVCERTDHWATALRLEFSRAAAMKSARCAGPDPPLAQAAVAEPRIIETRFADDCLATLDQAPQALVAVEISPENCDAQLALVREIAERFPTARVVVLAARELAGHEWLARELGAIHFTTSPRHLGEVVEIARRHWRHLPSAELTTLAMIRASLPWG